jgi:hypothetical protein
VSRCLKELAKAVEEHADLIDTHSDLSLPCGDYPSSIYYFPDNLDSRNNAGAPSLHTGSFNPSLQCLNFNIAFKPYQKFSLLHAFQALTFI